MKSKISITLSQDLLEELDDIIRSSGNRSQVIEAALREYIKRHVRDARERRDIELINKHADALNKEAKDVLSYQVKR